MPPKKKGKGKKGKKDKAPVKAPAPPRPPSPPKPIVNPLKEGRHEYLNSILKELNPEPSIRQAIDKFLQRRDMHIVEGIEDKHYIIPYVEWKKYRTLKWG